MSEGLGIEIVLRLHQMGTRIIPYSLFRKIVDALNKAVYESENEELAIIQAEFPDLPNVAFDAARYRLRQYRYDSILIKDLRQGSLVVVGAVAGVAIWVLQETLGETMKEAWLDSEWHQRIKSLLLRRMSHKRHSLSADAARRIERAVPSETNIGYDGPVDARVSEAPSRITIDVRIEVSTKDHPPDREEML